jgi:hypothetical protein
MAVTVPTPITDLPTAPVRGEDRATFVSKSNAFVAALPTFGAESNTLADVTYDNAVDAETSATESAASAVAALASEANAATSEANAATSAGNAATSESNAATSYANTLALDGYAEEWAINPEDSPVSIAAGGDGVTTFSSLHHAAKAEASASAAAASAASVDMPTIAGQGGKFLTNNGVDEMSWAEAPHDYEILQNFEITGSPLAIELALPSGYSSYQLRVQSMTAAISTALYVRTSSDGGVSFDSGASDYVTTTNGLQDGSTTAYTTRTTATEGRVTPTVGASTTAVIDILDAAAGADTLLFLTSRGGTRFNHGVIRRASTSVVDAIQLYCYDGASAQAITSGKITLVGIK